MKSKSQLSKRNKSQKPSKRKQKKTSNLSKADRQLLKEQNELLKEMKVIIEENKQDKMDPSEFSKMVDEQEKVMDDLHKIQSQSFSKFYLDGFHKAYNTYPNDEKQKDSDYTIVLPFGQSITVKAKGKKNSHNEPVITKRSTSKTKQHSKKTSSKKK